MPFSFSPAIYAGLALALFAGGVWLVDAIGDRREAKVHARYAAAAEATNIDVRAFNSEDERVSAIAEALREQALAKARTVPGKHLATKEQAAALSAIRWP